jgi:hypothetical protein
MARKKKHRAHTHGLMKHKHHDGMHAGKKHSMEKSGKAATKHTQHEQRLARGGTATGTKVSKDKETPMQRREKRLEGRTI